MWVQKAPHLVHPPSSSSSARPSLWLLPRNEDGMNTKGRSCGIIIMASSSGSSSGRHTASATTRRSCCFLDVQQVVDRRCGSSSRRSSSRTSGCAGCCSLDVQQVHLPRRTAEVKSRGIVDANGKLLDSSQHTCKEIVLRGERQGRMSFGGDDIE